MGKILKTTLTAFLATKSIEKCFLAIPSSKTRPSQASATFPSSVRPFKYPQEAISRPPCRKTLTRDSHHRKTLSHNTLKLCNPLQDPIGPSHVIYSANDPLNTPPKAPTKPEVGKQAIGTQTTLNLSNLHAIKRFAHSTHKRAR